MKKQLIIDGQILQTNAWHRGMGKYTLQLIREMSLIAPDDFQLAIIFNKNLNNDSIVFDTVKRICPRVERKHYDLPLPIIDDKRIEAKEYVDSLSEKLKRDFETDETYFLLTALFKFEYFAEFPEGCRRLLLFYDLIPLLFWQDLGGYFPPKLYMERFQKILDAECIFAISETTKEDLLNTFGLPSNRVININGGFTKVAKKPVKPTAFKVPSKYILFPTADLPYKNNDIAAKGFAEYADARNDVKLLITSHFHENSKEHLLSISNDVIFTGNVSDEELEWLSENSQAVLFASKYEGLGLPVLDAMANHKPVVVSKIPVFMEMSKDTFYFFEPTDYKKLTKALAQAVSRGDFETKGKNYSKIMNKYTWQNTCQGIINCIETMAPNNYPRSPLNTAKKPARPHIAIACINPGIRDQMGRLTEKLHFTLSKEFEIDYYFDTNGYHYREMERPTFLDFLNCKTYDISKLTTRTFKKYKKVVYFIDNNSLPSRLAQRASVLPGLMVDGSMKLENNKQLNMLREIIRSNQYNSYRLSKYTHANIQGLIKKLSNAVID